jgi:hypothetical protein
MDLLSKGDFWGTGGGALVAGGGVVVMGVMVAAVGVDVVDLHAFEFDNSSTFCKLEFLGQLSSHVALGSASETAPLSPELSSFLISKFTERNCYIGRVNVHRDVLVV